MTLTAGHAAVAMSAATASASGQQRLLAGAGGEDHSRVIVAGAGLAGLATAVALHKVCRVRIRGVRLDAANSESTKPDRPTDSTHLFAAATRRWATF